MIKTLDAVLKELGFNSQHLCGHSQPSITSVLMASVGTEGMWYTDIREGKTMAHEIKRIEQNIFFYKK